VDDDHSNLVPAVDRAIQILYAFQSGDESFGVSDLSRILDLNKSTVFDILTTLTFYNFLERDEESKKYRLGPALFHLGNLVGARLSTRDVAHSFVRDLAVDFAATAILGYPQQPRQDCGQRRAGTGRKNLGQHWQPY
jgi:IclR family transcriptional regulator, KDG regulon repressor